MELVPLRPAWPGLRASPGIEVYPPGLDEVCRAMASEVAVLGQTGGLGSLRAVRELREFTAAAAPARACGEWATASWLWTVHRSAVTYVPLVYRGCLHNLHEFVARLAAISAKYRGADEETEDPIRRLEAGEADHPPHRRETSSATVWEPGKPADRAAVPPRREKSISPTSPSRGVLAVPRHLPYPETAAQYRPHQIERWLRELYDNTAWETHYEMSRTWRAISDAIDSLCKALFVFAQKIDESLRDKSSPGAQDNLRHIEATSRALSEFSGTLASVAEHTGEALRQTLANLWLATKPSSHQARITFSFDQLTDWYREIVGSYPRELPYDLPYGGVTLPPPPPDGPEPPVGPPPKTPGPAGPADSFVVQPVIGAEVPQFMVRDINDRQLFDDDSPSGPGIIG